MTQVLLEAEGCYKRDSILKFKDIPIYDTEELISFFHMEGTDRVISNTTSAFKKMYIRSGSCRYKESFSAFGIYQSEKRMRVRPFLLSYTYFGDDCYVAFLEIITSKVYAMRKEDFLRDFSLDTLYNGQSPIV